jgi:hypothetical protein
MIGLILPQLALIGPLWYKAKVGSSLARGMTRFWASMFELLGSEGTFILSVGHFDLMIIILDKSTPVSNYPVKHRASLGVYLRLSLKQQNRPEGRLHQ